MRRPSPRLLLGLGAFLALHWLPLVGVIWLCNLSMPVAGCAAISLGALLAAVVIFEWAGGPPT
mgnify:CR=1 FL=1